MLLLEAEDRLGGRLRSEPRGDYWLNYGAHLFPAPGSLVGSMIRDCGLETASVTGSMMGLAVGSPATRARTGRDLSRCGCRSRSATGSRSRPPA